MPAASPTLSPTLSAIVAGFLGSSSGMPASTFPTRSAPKSAAFVKMPPPALMNNEMRLAPIPTPAIIRGSGYTKKSTVIPINAIAGTDRPTVAPPLNAEANAGPRPFPVACAALGAALTVILSEMRPAIPDSAAPTANATPFEKLEAKPIITASTIATGITILNSLLRNAIAPALTADEMFIMLSVPLCCLPTQTANPAATPIDATEAPMGSMSSKTICGLFPLDSLYKGLRATKQQLEQGSLLS